jgi:hypothetical protein
VTAEAVSPEDVGRDADSGNRHGTDGQAPDADTP